MSFCCKVITAFGIIIAPLYGSTMMIPIGLWQGCAEHSSNGPAWSTALTYLKLNETTAGTAPGGKDFKDSSPNGNHATKVNTVTFNQTGKLGKGVSFLTDAYAYISAPVPGINVSNGQQTTLMFWMNWNGGMPSGNSWSVPVGFSSMLSLAFNGNDNVFGFCTYSDDIYGIASSAFTPNTWYHITAIIKNGTMTANKLYINGVSQTLTQRRNSPLAANSKVSTTMLIGNLATGDNFAFQGIIDDFIVFNGVVSDSDIQAIYSRQNTLKRLCP